MERITKGLLFAACLTLQASLFTACTFEQDDYFDETAALRITHTNQKIQDRLVAQSTNGNYGWIIQYFVAGTDDYDFEGFNLFGRFYEDGKVTLAGNHRYLRNGNANKYTEATSTYNMLAEEGPVLSFDTWNDILTVFEDPVDPASAPSTLASNGEGMFGDHNLVLSSFNDDEIIFRGERHRAVVRFIPCDRPWEEYISAVSQLKNKISNTTLTSYYVTNSVDTMYFSRLNRGYFNYCDRVVDPLKNKVLSAVFTPDGFRIQNTDTLGKNQFQQFTLAEDESCLQNEDGSVKVIACWDKYIVDRTDVWKFDTNLFSTEQSSLYNQIDANLHNFNAACSIASIGIGKSTGSAAVNGLVVTFYTNAAKTKTNTLGIELTMGRPGYGKISIAALADGKVDRNLETVNNRTGNMLALLRAFAATVSGTYDMVPDDYFLPTGGTFTPVSGGTNFKLNK